MNREGASIAAGEAGRAAPRRIAVIFFVPLLLLVAPALHYALDTPIGLFEHSPNPSRAFDSAERFIERFVVNPVVETGRRYRPLQYVTFGLKWKLLGEVRGLQYLFRWLVWFGAVACFIVAFKRVSAGPSGAPAHGLAPPMERAWWHPIPVAMLAYICLLLPNPAVIRLEAPELYTVLFVGICNLAAASALISGDAGRRRHHVLFFLGFLGLVLVKEVNVAPALWLLLCYWAFVITKGWQPSSLLIGGAMALTLAFVVTQVAEALAAIEQDGSYAAPRGAFVERFFGNVIDVLGGIFQWETSAVLSAGFVLLLAFLAVVVVQRLTRRAFDGETAFIVLLLGEFGALLLVLGAQFGITIRYWFVLVPCLATLVAFAAKFILAEAQHDLGTANRVAGALVTFITFFVVANYYGFLYQVILQHKNRNADDELLTVAAKLIDAGEYMQANPFDQHVPNIWNLNSWWNYERHWPNSPYGERGLHREPPENAQRPFYILDFKGHPDLVSLETHTVLTAKTDYPVLDWPRRVAAWVQGQAPRVEVDSGMHADYWWVIHRAPADFGGYLRRLIVEAGEPVRGTAFDVHDDGEKLTYVNMDCEGRGLEEPFFLHLHPVNDVDLPLQRRQYGFDNHDFHFADWGVMGDGICLAQRMLPQFPIQRIDTGQYLYDGIGTRIWAVELHRPSDDTGR